MARAVKEAEQLFIRVVGRAVLVSVVRLGSVNSRLRRPKNLDKERFMTSWARIVNTFASSGYNIRV